MTTVRELLKQIFYYEVVEIRDFEGKISLLSKILIDFMIAKLKILIMLMIILLMILKVFMF